MPVQQTNSSFAGKLGNTLADAYAETAGKPIDLGGRRQLPANIRGGRAKLSAMYTKTQDKDDGSCPKGQVFFRASAIVTHPKECEGAVTQFLVPMCEIPEVVKPTYTKKGVSLIDNWNKFRSLIEVLGVAPYSEPPLPKNASNADKTAMGVRIEAYYMAAMNMLAEQAKKPPYIFIEFSTRGFTPKATADQPKPTEMVFEDWHGLAKTEAVHSNGQAAPGASMVDNTPPTAPHVAAPAAAPAQVAPPPPASTAAPQATDPADLVESLVEVCMSAVGATPEMAEASDQLQKMAWANGWSHEETADAADWSVVGDMALNKKGEGAAPAAAIVPVVGGKHKFAKRNKDGAKLADAKGDPLPPQEVEVVTVDATAHTCTVKSTKDGKPVVDIRTKQPVAVKFEWLE